MTRNPYTSSPVQAGPPPREAHPAGRVLAPLLVPLAWAPLAVVAGLLATGSELALPESVIAFLLSMPTAVMGLLAIAPLSMLALLPLRHMPWPRRALSAALIQAVLVLALAFAISRWVMADMPA